MTIVNLDLIYEHIVINQANLVDLYYLVSTSAQLLSSIILRIIYQITIIFYLSYRSQFFDINL